MKKVAFLLLSSLCIVLASRAQGTKEFRVSSPDKQITIHIKAGPKLLWSVSSGGHGIIEPSAISLQLGDGTSPGENVRVTSSPSRTVNTSFKTINYRKAEIRDHFNEITLNCRGDYAIQFRAYNDAVAYRFVLKKKGNVTVNHEEANFNFAGDFNSTLPIQWDYRGGETFNSSFEALYREIPLSKFPKDSLAFTPLAVETANNIKAVILEADLEDYPGMYLDLNENGRGLKSVFAPYPLEWKNGGHNRMNLIPTKRAEYIANIKGSRNLPWRVVAISRNDKDLLDNDIVQKLASPNRLQDVSWIKPGLVAWDWWNDWNISNVDFKAGINTPTYKYYIDFAAANKIPYIIIDDGWSNALDLYARNPDLNLEEVVAYGKTRNVGIIVWATWFAVQNQMDRAFPEFAKMGIKGLKIDFIDRDDQIAVASTYEIARKAAEYKMLVDYHGIHKPAGLQRTYPNVLGYEGVKGLENYKWANEDQPRYAVTIPFLRMLAGPMDYTPGAMRNATEASFRPINANPMSKGTRCHQLAMYVIYDAPLQMLSDNPTAYMREQECTDFIVRMPVTFDANIPLDGKMGEYVALARRKGNNWYVGAMTNWTAREITIDFSFLPEGNFKATVFRDGINADRDATDYKKEGIEVSKGMKLPIKLAPGGGWAAILEAD